MRSMIVQIYKNHNRTLTFYHIEQLIDGLCVGVDVNKSVQKKEYLYVTSATLREVSLVESPAFTAAQVTKVAASENEAETPIETKESEAIVEDKAPEPQSTEVEAATPTVEAARPTITASQSNYRCSKC